jgi:hypothetical protein
MQPRWFSLKSQETDMKQETSRICLAVTLLALTVAALLTGLRAQHDGVAIEAHIAGMQLQGMPETDAAATPDEDDKFARCPITETSCAAPEALLAFAAVSGEIPGGKTSAIMPDVSASKSID